MDKVNLTIAILPMAQECGWSPATQGLVQSAFFYGFLLAQIPAGTLASRNGGRAVLPVGVSVWSAATFCVPLVSGCFPALCASRMVMGLGESVAPSAIVDMLARTVPREERASAISTAFGGLHVGSIIGLLASPAIISAFGWQALFYIFGGAGLLWYYMFEGLIASLADRDPDTLRQLLPSKSVPSLATYQEIERTYLDEANSDNDDVMPMSLVSASSPGARASSAHSIPYRAFLRSQPVQALACAHFAHNWLHYTMLAWLPTYFVDTLSVDLMHAAQTALLPPLAGIAASAAAGSFADRLIKGGVPTAVVRKLAQCTAFLVPSMLLVAACQCPCTPEDSNAAVACITLALGMSSFSLAGLYCTHQDLSPKYASAMLGLTNVAASVPGIIGVAAVGAMFEATHSWQLSLFMPSVAFMVAGAGIFTLGSQHEQVDFDVADNSPFAWEAHLRPLVSMTERVLRAATAVASSLQQLLPVAAPYPAVGRPAVPATARIASSKTR